jgi:hypothetical protein
MTSQQQADLLLACWQSMPKTPPAERLDRIDFIRRSMGRIEANDNDYPSQRAVHDCLNVGSPLSSNKESADV